VTGPTTYIAPIGNGLGDLVVSLPVVQALIEQGEKTVLVLRSPRQEGFAELVPGLAGCVREVDIPLMFPDGMGEHRYLNLREHRLQTDYVWGSAEFEQKYPGYKIADIVRDISRDFGIDADFGKLKPLPFRDRVELHDTVLFIPGSDGIFKCWLTDSWLELAYRIESAGMSVAVVGQPHRSIAVSELIEGGLSWLVTATLSDALDVVSSARAVVSIDTGLLHLALQQLVPSVGIWINNPGSLNYSRTVHHCFPLISPRCSPSCVSEELDKNLNLVTEFGEWRGYDSWMCHASQRDRCMNNVSVDSVWEQFQRAIEWRSAPVSLNGSFGGAV
jgi:Glycosyltransferase family 9 (heptosyltransferase)